MGYLTCFHLGLLLKNFFDFLVLFCGHLRVKKGFIEVKKGSGLKTLFKKLPIEKDNFINLKFSQSFFFLRVELVIF
jgi:hypothetical protein